MSRRISPRFTAHRLRIWRETQTRPARSRSGIRSSAGFSWRTCMKRCAAQPLCSRSSLLRVRLGAMSGPCATDQPRLSSQARAASSTTGSIKRWKLTEYSLLIKAWSRLYCSAIKEVWLGVCMTLVIKSTPETSSYRVGIFSLSLKKRWCAERISCP